MDTFRDLQDQNLQSYIEENQQRFYDDRRLMWLSVTPNALIMDWKRTDARTIQVVGNPLPEDAKVMRADYNRLYDRIDMLVHSMAFNSVPPDAAIPHYPDIVFKDWTVRVRLEPIE